MENLDKIIDLLEHEKDENNEAYLGAFYMGDHETTCLKANKQGIVCFARELLKTLRSFDFHLGKQDHYAVINFKKEEWFDENSDIQLDVIEPTLNTRKEIHNDLKSENNEAKWYEGFFIITMILLFILSLIVGFVQIIIWLYKLIF